MGDLKFFNKRIKVRRDFVMAKKNKDQTIVEQMWGEFWIGMTRNNKIEIFFTIEISSLTQIFPFNKKTKINLFCSIKII